MKREEIFKALNVIFKDIFDDETIVVSETTNSEEIEDWDSLEHINLVIAIENRFGIKFKMEEINQMKNVGDMVAVIIERTE